MKKKTKTRLNKREKLMIAIHAYRKAISKVKKMHIIREMQEYMYESNVQKGICWFYIITFGRKQGPGVWIDKYMPTYVDVYWSSPPHLCSTKETILESLCSRRDNMLKELKSMPKK